MQSPGLIKGLHHITLVCGNAQRNASFFVDLLGLQFVKKTVNFDRHNTYHLYYGQENGRPGTLVTYFEWPHADWGRIGAGTVHHFAMTVDTDEAQLKWKRRLLDAGVSVSGPYDRHAFKSIYFNDPDGVICEIATAGPGWAHTQDGEDIFLPPQEALSPFRDESAISALSWPDPVPVIEQDMRLGGLHHISAMSGGMDRTAEFYAEVLEIPLVSKSVNYDDPSMPHWYWGLDDGRPGSVMTYFGLAAGQAGRGKIGRGLTHHVAFDVEDDDALLEMRERFQARDLEVTEILDRKYFRSIYTTDPDGLILECATSGPGFLVDQSEEELGEALALPTWLEDRRAQIEPGLSAIDLRRGAPAGR